MTASANAKKFEQTSRYFLSKNEGLVVVVLVLSNKKVLHNPSVLLKYQCMHVIVSTLA